MDKIKLNPFHTTDVKELKIDGTAITVAVSDLNKVDGVTATTAELNALDGVESSTAELDTFILRGEIINISAGVVSTWVVSPYAATIERIDTVIDGAIANANANITFEIGGTAVTDGAIVIATVASAAGITDTATPTALNTVAAGGAIEIITDGGSTNAVRAVVILTMQRT